MTSKITNVILFIIITTLLVLAYVFFIKKPPEEGNLVSSFVSSSSGGLSEKDNSSLDSSITKDFLSVLLNVKSIKLNDAIFSDEAFSNLKDSSILLTSTGDEGRSNPFAPIGYEATITPKSSTITVPQTTTPETSITTMDSSVTPVTPPTLP